MSEYDANQSAQGRNSGMGAVLANNARWADDVGAFIISLPRDWVGTGEDIRRLWSERGGNQPRHHNAWGGVIHGAVSRGILFRTGRRTNMIAVKSHSRATDVYTRSSAA